MTECLRGAVFEPLDRTWRSESTPLWGMRRSGPPWSLCHLCDQPVFLALDGDDFTSQFVNHIPRDRARQLCPGSGATATVPQEWAETCYSTELRHYYRRVFFALCTDCGETAQLDGDGMFETHRDDDGAMCPSSGLAPVVSEEQTLAHYGYDQEHLACARARDRARGWTSTGHRSLIDP